jgi:IS5 family transposase
MKPKANPRTHEQPLIATMRLDLALDMDHELVRLSEVIPWDALAGEFGPLYCADNGRPAVPIPIRLMAGLHYLKHLMVNLRPGGTTNKQLAIQGAGSGRPCVDDDPSPPELRG